MIRIAYRLPLAALLVAALLVFVPTISATWRERSAIREFQAGLMAIEVARQDQLLKGASPLDKGRTPAHDLALQPADYFQAFSLAGPMLQMFLYGCWALAGQQWRRGPSSDTVAQTRRARPKRSR